MLHLLLFALQHTQGILYTAALLPFVDFAALLRLDYRVILTTSPTDRALFPVHFLEPSLNVLGTSFDMYFAGMLSSVCGFCVSHMVEGGPLNRSSQVWNASQQDIAFGPWVRGLVQRGMNPHVTQRLEVLWPALPVPGFGLCPFFTAAWKSDRCFTRPAESLHLSQHTTHRTCLFCIPTGVRGSEVVQKGLVDAIVHERDVLRRGRCSLPRHEEEGKKEGRITKTLINTAQMPTHQEERKRDMKRHCQRKGEA
jgi:hypothetical protein